MTHTGQAAAIGRGAPRLLLICFGLGLGSALALGIGRFAYALVLPAMQADLAWSFSEAGALNAANALGYLAGALLAAMLIARFGVAATFIVGGLVTAAAIGATAVFDRFDVLLAIRFVPGFTGALTFVAGGTLVARAASGLGQRTALGVGLFYGGPGIGIVVSAAVVPPVLANGVENWPLAWIGLGAAAAVMALVASLAALTAARGAPLASTGAGGSAASLAPALIGYTFFAAGYVGYITFIIAGVREHGGSSLQSALWWAGLGLGGIASSWIWARLIQSVTDGRALAILTGLTGVAALLPLLDHGMIGFSLSFVLFGATFLSVVAAAINLVRLARPAARLPVWIGYFTISFGLGQTIGPIASGAVADWLGSTDGVLWFSGLLLLAGGLIAGLQRPVA